MKLPKYVDFEKELPTAPSITSIQGIAIPLEGSIEEINCSPFQPTQRRLLELFLHPWLASEGETLLFQDLEEPLWSMCLNATVEQVLSKLSMIGWSILNSRENSVVVGTGLLSSKRSDRLYCKIEWRQWPAEVDVTTSNTKLGLIDGYTFGIIE